MNKKELRELCEKATPGPWKPCGANNDRCICGLVWANEHVPLQGDDTEPNPTADDAAFIAAARSAVPALLDENEKLRAALREALEIAKRLNFQRGLIGATADYRARLKRTAEADLARISELRSHLDER